MSIDTYFYFLIVLGGFAVVWSFRHFSRSRNTIGDFEYLGFSSFWGILLVGAYAWLMRNQPQELTAVLSNPFAAGGILFLFGLLIGYVTGKIAKPFV